MASGSRLDGLRVLVVDDEPDTVEVTCMQLERAGAQVECATTADDGLALLASAEPPFDVLLCDYRLHGPKDGIWLIGAIRRLEGPKARTPAIAFTGEAGFVAHAELIRAGFNARLVKPATTSQVQSAILRLARP